MRSLEPMLYGVTPESNSVSLSFGPINYLVCVCAMRASEQRLFAAQLTDRA